MDVGDFIEIQNLVHRYCDRLDRGDFDGMAALFDRADVYLPGTDTWFRRDPAGLAATYREWVRVYEDGTPRTRHVTTNLIVESDGAETATAQSYVTVFQSTPSLSLQPIIGGRNIDRFVKDGGVWRFAQRSIESDMFGDLSLHLRQSFGPN